MNKFTAILVPALLMGAAVAHAQPTFDDRSAQLDAQIQLVGKENQLQEALRRSAGASVTGLPTVLSIMGMDGRFSTRLQQPNGVVRIYREGESIQTGMVVTAITPRAVAVTIGQGKKAKTIELQAMAGAVGPGSPMSPGGMGGPGSSSPLPPELLPLPPSVPLPMSK